MKRVNRTKFVLLGLLANRPRTGYEIKKAIESSIGHFWFESFGQIYPYLKKLVAENAALAEDIKEEGRPLRKIYKVTPYGIEILEEWLRTEVQAEKPRNEFLLKIFFGRRLGSEHTMGLFKNKLMELEEKITFYKAIETDLRGGLHLKADASYWLMTLRHSILECQARILWCQECMEILKEEAIL
jgi:DNA-binding PadR family transcriptional regulator